MHCLRHRFVFKAFRQLESLGIRVDDAVPFLSVYLGHYDLSETEKYMKFSATLFPEELEKFDSFSEGFFPDPEEVST
jgi:integrase